MAIMIARFRTGSETARWGVWNGKQIRPADIDGLTLSELVELSVVAIKEAMTGAPIDLADCELLSPLDSSSRLYCLGLNYADHREETGHDAAKPDEMLVFAKDGSSLCGPSADIVKPASVELLDYEVELGLVLKSTINSATKVTDENLKQHIAGLIICNDVSARDDQFGSPFLQWFRAKSYRTFCPAGPYLWLPEDGELEEIYDLIVECRVNGEIRQKASTSDFIFRPPEALSRLSHITNWRRGDCLLTGTPGGVALSLSSETQAILKSHLFDDRKRRAAFIDDQKAGGRYLNVGDVVELSIKSPNGVIDLGSQKNEIVE